ncbi:MAG: hypothetical protein AAFR66_23465 [Bacteroidota bacterium]
MKLSLWILSITFSVLPLYKGENLGIPLQLSQDYQQLSAFSTAMGSYRTTIGDFQHLFLEGALESYQFYANRTRLAPFSVNRLISRELMPHAGLGHSIEKPKTVIPNVDFAFQALNQFSGEWHGQWRDMKVHHLWLPVRQCKIELSRGVMLIGFQSCYTGDGFGWNYVVREGEKIIVLGFVYHFNERGMITSRNPHYAFLNPQKQLTWISNNHVYYEFVCDNIHCNHGKHYVITGGQYSPKVKKAKLLTGFQAVYSSDSLAKPSFQQLVMDEITRTKELFFKKIISGCLQVGRNFITKLIPTY